MAQIVDRDTYANALRELIRQGAESRDTIGHKIAVMQWLKPDSERVVASASYQEPYGGGKVIVTYRLAD